MNILISGCLLGIGCRYDGKKKPLPEETLNLLKDRFNLIPVCPEQLGGLPTPRIPSERCGDKFIMADGTDVTENYRRGAKDALYIAKLFNCNMALLKEKSPSCGCGLIYDGSFSKTLAEGDGMTAQVLKENGVKVFGESQIKELLKTAK